MCACSSTGVINLLSDEALQLEKRGRILNPFSFTIILLRFIKSRKLQCLVFQCFMTLLILNLQTDLKLDRMQRI